MRATLEGKKGGQWIGSAEGTGGGGSEQFILGRNHFERAPRDVVVTPLHDDGVAALVLDSVGDVVKLVARVLDIHLFAGSVGSVHAHHQHVGSCAEQREGRCESKWL